MPVELADLDLIAIEKVSSLDYLAQMFRCYASGRVAVPVGREDQYPGLTFVERLSCAPGGGWFDLAVEPIRSDSPAQLSFSSGTTGTPKAILLSHRALADVTERLVEVTRIDNELREYLGVPATFSFGLARARAAAAVGGSLFVPDHGFDPAQFAQMLGSGEVNALSAVPTLLRALIRNPAIIGTAGTALRWLEIGSQAMSGDEKRAIRDLFPAARIVQHYGLTEASRTTFLDIGAADEWALGSVGEAIGQTEIRIDADSRICIRGPHVADGILIDGVVVPIVDQDGWLVTNDIGRIEHGRLFFEGRADDLINCGGVKVAAEALERALLARLGPSFEIAAGPAPDADRGERAIVAWVGPPGADGAVRHAADQVAGDFLLSTASISLLPLSELPRTETGKVQRRSLATLAAKAPAALPPTQDHHPNFDRLPRGDTERKLAALWEKALNVSPVYRDESFLTMGGDSLSAINAALIMEREGLVGDVTHQIFEGRTIAEIAADLDGEKAQETSDGPTQARRAMTPEARGVSALNIARGILVLVVMAGHWGPFFVVRTGDVAPLIGYAINPLFRFGTPGFAIIFGIGIGYFHHSAASRNAAGLRLRLRRSALIVGGGIVALALSNAVLLGSTRGYLGDQAPTELFYSVLVFYLLAILSVVPLLKLIDIRPGAVMNALILSILSYAIYLALDATWGADQQRGVLELLRLLIVAKYSYFALFGPVLMGTAVGLWIRLNLADADMPQSLGKAGLATIAAGLVLTMASGEWEDWFTSAVSTMPAEIAYLGVVMLIIAAAAGRLARVSRVKGLFLYLELVGMLAFPIYIGHKVVMPVKDALETVIPAPAATAITVSAFLAVILFALNRLYRIVYNSKASPAPLL